MNSDLWTIILARLPLKSITTCKLVCNEWKSIVESPFLRELFLCHHQNSHSSWSLICSLPQKEILAHYGCDSWGLSRSLGSYISSFLTDKFGFDTLKKKNQGKVRVVSYTDVGLILICFRPDPSGRRTLYVANPISRQCVEIPPPPRSLIGLRRFVPSGLATQVGNGLVLGYKVVMVNFRIFNNPKLLIYSSETGLWTFNTLHSSLTLISLVSLGPVSLNGSLYWLGSTTHDNQVVVSHDFYTGSSDQCQVILFPDSDIGPNINRGPCRACQGFLMYMHISLELKLRIWRLESGEWQLVSQISPPCIKTAFDYVPLAINPFDGDTLYLQSKMHLCLASTNLHKGNLDHTSDCGTLSFAGQWAAAVKGHYIYFHMFVLPPWLYRIPSSPS